MALQPTYSARTIIDGTKTVTTAGTAVQLVAAITRADQIDITAHASNGGTLVVGASTVVAALSGRRGTPLVAGDTWSAYNVDLSQIWLDTTNSGDKATYTAVTY